MSTIWTDAATIRSGGAQNTLHKKRRTGWAYVVMQEDKVVYQESGRLNSCTSTLLAELHAVVQALNSFYAPGSTINTDCQHVARLFAGENIKLYDKKSLIKARTKAKELDVKIQWVRSHGGDKGAKLADDLAREVIGLPSSDAWGKL